MLIDLGFTLNFVNWVMNCVTSISFAVLKNGSTLEFFRPTRGLKQGCPLSPLLFLLVAKPLSRALLEAKTFGDFKGIRVCRSLYISHLLLVDDILLLCDGSWRDALKLRNILDLYYMATRMMVMLISFKLSKHK
jgi:hypothetical protein